MSDGELLVEFVVLGEPVPQGSMQAMVPTHPKTKQPYRRAGGDGIVVNVKASNEKRLTPWRSEVADAARLAWGERPLVEGVALRVEADFYMKRPEGHWGTGRNAHLLKDSAPAVPLVYPDADKLLRAVLDSLTGVVYKDDGLVSSCPPEKHYAVPSEEGDGQRVEVRVFRRAVQLATDLPMEARVRFVASPERLAAEAQLALEEAQVAW